MAYKPYTIPKAPTLARVASSSDPFGLSSGTAGLFGATPPVKAPTARPYSSTGSQQRAGVGVDGATNGGVHAPAATLVETAAKQTPVAPSFSYDINTDPAYQTAESLVGQSNAQATAAAAKQRRDMLLAYGDPTLAGEAALGGDSTLAQAAAQNPTSTVAGLKDQYTQGLQDFENALDPSLFYSGYRTKQEQRAATNYQNTLAQAAAALNGNLDTVDQNLNAALAANQGQQIQAANSAADRGWQEALSGLLAPTTTTTPDTGGGSGSALAGAAANGAANAGSFVDPTTVAAMLAKAQQNAAQPSTASNLRNLLRGAVL